MTSCLAVGLYWSATHNLIYIETKNAGRDQYYGLVAAVSYLLLVIAPAVGGAVIAQNWFRPLGQGLNAEYPPLSSCWLSRYYS